MKPKIKSKTKFQIEREVAALELQTKRYHVKVKDNQKYDRRKAKKVIEEE